MILAGRFIYYFLLIPSTVLAMGRKSVDCFESLQLSTPQFVKSYSGARNRPILHGSRVTLMPLEFDDLALLTQLASAEGVAEGFGVLLPKETIEDTMRSTSENRHGFFAGWVIIYRGQKVGFRLLAKQPKSILPPELRLLTTKYFEYNCPDQFYGSLIYYTAGAILPNYRGLGIGPESLHVVTEFALKKLAIGLVVTRVLSHNERSLRSVEKAGFYPIPLRPRPHESWDLDFSEWFSSADLMLN